MSIKWLGAGGTLNGSEPPLGLEICAGRGASDLVPGLWPGLILQFGMPGFGMYFM
jgi:hypothetical protein